MKPRALRISRRRRLRGAFRSSLAALKKPQRISRVVASTLPRSTAGVSSSKGGERLDPVDSTRQRLLDGVLAALRQLTQGAA